MSTHLHSSSSKVVPLDEKDWKDVDIHSPSILVGLGWELLDASKKANLDLCLTAFDSSGNHLASIDGSPHRNVGLSFFQSLSLFTLPYFL